MRTTMAVAAAVIAEAAVTRVRSPNDIKLMRIGSPIVWPGPDVSHPPRRHPPRVAANLPAIV
jgi:hypothetical protein